MTDKEFFWIENKTLSLLMTTNCNQSCIMCPQHLNDDFVDHDIVLKEFISQIRNLHCNEIYITGGEPFLKSKLIDCLFLSTKKEKITILTNGSIMPSDIVLKSRRTNLCIPLYVNCAVLSTQNFYRFKV